MSYILTKISFFEAVEWFGQTPPLQRRWMSSAYTVTEPMFGNNPNFQWTARPWNFNRVSLHRWHQCKHKANNWNAIVLRRDVSDTVEHKDVDKPNVSTVVMRDDLPIRVQNWTRSIKVYIPLVQTNPKNFRYRNLINISMKEAKKLLPCIEKHYIPSDQKDLHHLNLSVLTSGWNQAQQKQ